MNKPKVYDRLSDDLPINSVVAETEVDDPLEPGAKLRVIRSLRDDVLAQMFARAQIEQHCYEAGRLWQRYYERSQIGGAKAIDTTKEPVDGGGTYPDPLSETMAAASHKIRQADKILGRLDSRIVRCVLGDGMGFTLAAGILGYPGQRGSNYIGRRVRDALDSLSEIWGFRTKR